MKRMFQFRSNPLRVLVAGSHLAIRCDPHFGRSVRDTERVSEGEKGNAKES
jgi:hypothetical protein